MKIKVDSCLSTQKEFYGTIYPESEKEAQMLVDLIQIQDSIKVKEVSQKSKDASKGCGRIEYFGFDDEITDVCGKDGYVCSVCDFNQKKNEVKE